MASQKSASQVEDQRASLASHRAGNLIHSPSKLGEGLRGLTPCSSFVYGQLGDVSDRVEGLVKNPVEGLDVLGGLSHGHEILLTFADDHSLAATRILEVHVGQVFVIAIRLGLHSLETRNDELEFRDVDGDRLELLGFGPHGRLRLLWHRVFCLG